MRKATLHISNNQASVSITMPSSPQHKSQSSSRRKDSSPADQQPLIHATTPLNLSGQSGLLTKNVGPKHQHSITSPRSPSPLYDTEQLLSTSNQATSFRYPSQPFVITQAALSSAPSTTMSNAHFQQQQHQQQQAIQQTGPNPQAQLKSQQDLEEQYFATIESSALVHNTLQSQRQKSSRKPKLLRQAHAELMELPRVTRDRLPSATPSSFSNYSGTCGFSTNYTAGLTPPFSSNPGGYFGDQAAGSAFGERGTAAASNYYNYFEDANSFVAKSASATAAAATQLSNNPNLRNLSFISNSQSSQTHPPTNAPAATDLRNLTIRDQQQNSMNTGRLASELSQHEVDSSFEYLNRLSLRCRSVPLLAIYIKNEPDPPDDELIRDEPANAKQESKQSQSSDKELITFIDFLNENSTSNEKIDQIKEQQSPNKPQDSDQVRLEKISSSDEDGYADVESISEIMNFSNRQQTVIKRDKRERHSVDIVKTIDERPAEKADFLIDSQFDKLGERKDRRLSDDGLELEEEEEEDDDFGGDFEDGDELRKLLPSTPSQYSLFQKLMNKHTGGKEGGSSNQNTSSSRKHSSDIESQSRSNAAASHHKHRHRRKNEDGSLVVLEDQSNQQQPDQSSEQQKTYPQKPHKKHSKKIKDKQPDDHRDRKRSDEAGWSDMPNAELQHQQLKALMKSEHIQTSNSLPSSRSMQLCQANSFGDQANDPSYLISSGDQMRQLNMRSNSKESVKSPKLEKKKRKFSRKALNLLKVKHFQKSKSEETGKELESLASKTLAAVCKARSYNYNLIKNINEYNLSQQSSVFNSANNSYEENYHMINPGVGPHQSSHFNAQQTHQCQHGNQYMQQLNKAPLGQLQSTALNPTPGGQSATSRALFDPTQTGQPPPHNDPLINDDTRLFAVHLHNTDRKLKSSKGIVNPVVKVHVVNLITGEYVHTSDFVYQSSIGANAGTYLGSLQGKEYIQPLTTQPCDLLFKFRYPKNPSWEETVVFNESFDFLRQNDVILFFEILDYVRLEHSDLLSSFQLKHYSYRVAYGYFLLSNLQNQLGNQMIKLQLYKPYMHTVEKTFDPYCQIYNWWKNYKRIQYPCSLFLTLTTVSIRELSNLKHPIHLRILNKSLTQQYINQRRLLDYNESNQSLIQQQQADFDQTGRQSQPLNYPVRNLKQFQQIPTNNSSIEDQAEPPHPPYNQAMAMPSGHLHSATTQQQTFHQTSLPSAQPASTQQTAAAAQRQQSASRLSNWNKSSAGSTNSQQHCKLPSSTWHQLSAGNNKCCYNVAFSNDGTKIACCASVFTAYMSNEKRSSIFIYDLPSGSFLQRVNGFHSAPIYYLDWSKNDKLLASASADCTCLVWQMRRAHCAPLCLAHPCFVYTVKFHPNNHYQLATGAFDGAVRLWCIQESLKSTIKEPILLQCVAATGSVAAATFHGQVLALCWMHCLVDYIGPNGPEHKNELLLFSGCSRGNLMALKQDELSLSWQPSKKMKLKEIGNIAVNEIQCCPNDSRFIILFCRDGVQRMVDIFSETITMRYIGSLNFNHLIRGCLSTDGKFLFAGSEDAIVHVWNVDTGERIYTYNNLPFRGSIASINYHPHEDIIAISGLNARTISVCLYKHHARELPSPKPKHGSDPNYLQSAAASSQPIAKASMVTSNPSGHTTVSFARDEYKQEEYMMTNKSVGSLTSATERTRLTKSKPELKKSHTIDHSSNSSSTSMPSKANQKVQKAMRKLELALRLSFNEKS